jgi:hypothetical protein
VIFPPDAPPSSSTFPLGIKVSCAACLLERVPNGFVFINSTIKTIVECARDEARKNAQGLLQNGKKLHADHADNVLVLSSKLLQPMPLSRNAEVNKFIQNSLDNHCSLKEQLNVQGMDVQGLERIVLGHHLKSLLMTFKNQKEDCFLLAIAYRDESNENGSTTIQLDLPGGKRHLGESSFDCAIRETMEETSLLVDATWQVGENHQPLNNTQKGDFCNVFYDLHPPVPGPHQDNKVQNVVNALSQIQLSV